MLHPHIIEEVVFTCCNRILIFPTRSTSSYEKISQPKVESYDRILRNSPKVNPTAGKFPKNWTFSLVFLSFLPTLGHFFLIPWKDFLY